MLGVAYCLAAVLAFIGGLAGNRVAWPLLGSFAFYQVACWQEWKFDETLWTTVDCVVLILIAIVLARAWTRDSRWKPSASDMAVVLLFALLIPSYALPEAPAHLLSMTVAIVQLLFVFPLLMAWRLLTKASSDMAGKDDFDLMVRA